MRARPLRTSRGVSIRTLILVAGAVACLSAQTPSRVRATSLLDDLARGFHPRAAGYLDLFQANTLLSGAGYARPYGTLEGYVQRRRIAALMQDPDSLAPRRLGLFGAWDQGGWADDAYFGTEPTSGEDITLWSGGLAIAVPSLEADLVGGFVHGRKTSWKSPVDRETFEPSGTAAFALGRWKRGTALAIADDEGLDHLRLGFEPTATPLESNGTFIFPQILGSVNWSRARWNPWEAHDAFGVDLGYPVWKDRIVARAEAGSEGFRQVRLECDASSEGVVGLDVSYARTRSGRRLPGIRLRIPLFTLGWNDPLDAAALGTDPQWPVWSARLQMVWDGPEAYYRPGRRPSPGSSR